MFGKIRIETKGPNSDSKWWRFFLDDHEITRYVSGLEINARSFGIPNITLHLVAQVELPDEIQALITIDKPELILEGIL